MPRYRRRMWLCIREKLWLVLEAWDRKGKSVFVLQTFQPTQTHMMKWDTWFVLLIFLVFIVEKSSHIVENSVRDGVVTCVNDFMLYYFPMHFLNFRYSTLTNQFMFFFSRVFFLLLSFISDVSVCRGLFYQLIELLELTVNHIPSN